MITLALVKEGFHEMLKVLKVEFSSPIEIEKSVSNIGVGGGPVQIGQGSIIPPHIHIDHRV